MEATVVSHVPSPRPVASFLLKDPEGHVKQHVEQLWRRTKQAWGGSSGQSLGSRSTDLDSRIEVLSFCVSGLRYVCVLDHKHGQYANQQKLAIESECWPQIPWRMLVLTWLCKYWSPVCNFISVVCHGLDSSEQESYSRHHIRLFVRSASEHTTSTSI